MASSELRKQMSQNSNNDLNDDYESQQK
jgi:serum/glucocorticoid-regulated kinase 2